MNTLPAVEDCLDLYLRIHDHFGTETFTRERLAEVVDHDDDRPLRRLLELLVAYGLLDRRGERYSVQCAPDDGIDRWRAVAVARAERLHRLVARRESVTDAATRDDSLAHDGETFASVYVDDTDDVDAVETALVDALTAHPACDGVVLRAAGDLAATVQRVADRLSAHGVERRPWRFEKTATELVGAEKDHLEFRLYLRRRSG
ncbi:hypothetical protein [Haloplanus aerogenes]|uniref:Uncharacterized protein n=1 Tax=Haloplanus aerogenes TaxID=660522 RepID=A0A3G8QS68_9EURY|nr:hypothetical protein [Haloplanus aerogenes]AZH24538.1 hypothetical protein DU502_03690 [Haloplanus aerogenes]